MQVSKTNHRYCGWRESAKLVSQTKSAAADLSAASNRQNAAVLAYDRDFPDLLDALSDDLNYIQSARLLSQFIKESLL